MTKPESSTAAIIVAAFNAEATIAKAVKSALDDPGVSEICVVDDASSDATLDAARACDRGDGRLQVLRLTTNSGPSAARNAAIEATRSPWIGVLDADDYLLAGRTQALMALAGSADFIADALLRTSATEPPPAIPAPPQVAREQSFESFVLGNLTPRRGELQLGFLKPLMRRSFLDRHTLRYRADMRLGEDYELYVRALALGARFLLTDAAGYVSIVRPGSLSDRHGEDDLRRMRDCDKDLAAIRPLTASEQRALDRHTANVDCRLQWRLLINAVKARDWRASAQTFHSPQSALYLTAKLAVQAWRRASAGLFRERHP